MRVKLRVWGALFLGASCGLAAAQVAGVGGGGEEAVGFRPAPVTVETGAGSFVPASIHGTVVDQTEAAVPGATVSIEDEASGERHTMASAADGSFVFEAVSPGAYRVTVRNSGFGDWNQEASLRSGEHLELASVALAMTASAAVVEVRASGREIAAAQLQLEEKQRVMGIFPNFYASYAPDAEPLSARQKFHLAARFSGDPVAFAVAGIVAGSEQSENAFSGYGHGTVGYLKRFGATYTDGVTSTLIGQALLPAVFHQDPRYFVKETGSVRSRVLYAMASMVICKGDNRRWQLNYSNVLGNFASAAISNTYYPAANRGTGLVLQNALTATALGAVGGLFQEFFLHRMTPHVPEYEALR